MTERRTTANGTRGFYLDRVIATDLVHCQIYASIGDDAQNIWDVALVKCLHSLILEDLLGTVKHS